MAATDNEPPVATWDIVVIAVYFVAVMSVGLISSWRAKRGTSKGYFLAGKSMTWIPIAGSIFAANIGAPTFVGLAGSAAAQGIAPAVFEWHAAYILILLGWVFVPCYIASGAYTMPEFLRKRYGGQRLRVYYSVVQLLMTVVTGISGEMYAGGLFIQQILRLNVYLSVIVILLITAIYTIGGGLQAVMFTDTLQSVVLIVGSAILSAIAMTKVGGYDGLRNLFISSAANYTYLQQSKYNNLSCGFAPADSFQMLRSIDSGYPWVGLIFGLTIIATYFFCTNQAIVQRTLTAKNVSHGKGACVVASYLKFLPFFLFVLPGMVSRVLFPDDIACASPEKCQEICSNPAGCTNLAYPLLVLRIMPTGVKGLMLAGLLAALMSSLTSNFTSASTLFTLDIWRRFRPHAAETELMVTGRVFGLLMMGLAMAWLPILQAVQGAQLWNYLQAINSYITPPWCMCFVLGIFWTRMTEQGAFWGLMVGLVVGMCRLVIHFSYGEPHCGDPTPDPRPDIFTKVHYLHFAIILAAISAATMIIVSFLTKPRPPQKLRKVTFWTRHAKEQPELTDDEEDTEEERIHHTEEVKEEVEEESESCPRRVFNVICGINKSNQDEEVEQTKEELEAAIAASTDVSENPFWKKVVDANAIIVIAVTFFLIGFFN